MENNTNKSKYKLSNSFFIKKFDKLFLLVVALPTLVSSVYFGVIASDVYVSESSFVVRSSKSQTSLTGLGAILQNAGFARSADDTSTVHEYMRSRDALFSLNQDGSYEKHYSQKNIDFISRYNPFGSNGSFEALYKYFQDNINIDVEAASSISTLRVKAFSAEAAQKYNQQLLEKGELLINQLNVRGRQDVVGYAEKELAIAEQRVSDTSKALNDYRIKNAIFDVKEEAKIGGQLISKLQDELISVKTQLAQVQAVTPDNPQVITLKARERSIRTEINAETKKILGVGNYSLANKTADYERLALENKLAEQQLTSALSALDGAKNDAQKKQLYLERIVQPNLPDYPLYPKRIRNIFATLILSFGMYGILKLLFASVREHQG